MKTVKRSMKRSLSVFVCLAMLAGFCMSCATYAFADGAVGGFADVKASKWYAGAVRYCKSNGYMAGVSETAFKPDDLITRAMLVTTLWRLEGAPKAELNMFSDVPDDAWYMDAANWGLEVGVIAGTEDGAFSPNEPATREQIALTLFKLGTLRGADFYARDDLGEYRDAFAVSDWALEGVQWAVASGLICGKGDGVLDPLGTATRAELSQMLFKFTSSLKTYEYDPDYFKNNGVRVMEPILPFKYTDMETRRYAVEETPENTSMLFQQIIGRYIDSTVSVEDLNAMKAYALFDVNGETVVAPLRRDGFDVYTSDFYLLKHVYNDNRPRGLVKGEIVYFIGDVCVVLPFETHWEYEFAYKPPKNV